MATTKIKRRSDQSAAACTGQGRGCTPGNDAGAGLSASTHIRKLWKQLVARAPCRPRGAGAHGAAGSPEARPGPLLVQALVACCWCVLAASHAAQVQYFLGKRWRDPDATCELLLNPIENRALFCYCWSKQRWQVDLLYSTYSVKTWKGKSVNDLFVWLLGWC